MHKLFYYKFIRCLGIQKTYYKTFFALSWLITKIMLRCTVNKTSKNYIYLII